MTKENDPVWTAEKIDQEATKLFEHYLELYNKDKFDAFTDLLAEFSGLVYVVKQLQEAFKENYRVSNGAYENSHKAVELYQQLDGMFKTHGAAVSKRLEKLEK